MTTEKSYTIDAWCALRQISRSTFYNLKRDGKAPRTYRVRSKPYISTEADREWVQAREAEATDPRQLSFPFMNGSR